MSSVLVPNCKCVVEGILTPSLVFLGIMQKWEAGAWRCWLVRRGGGLGDRGGVAMWPGRGDLRTVQVGAVMRALEGDDETGRSIICCLCILILCSVSFFILLV